MTDSLTSLVLITLVVRATMEESHWKLLGIIGSCILLMIFSSLVEWSQKYSQGIFPLSFIMIFITPQLFSGIYCMITTTLQ
jgi:lipid-A-disaccharide synthase-like uncharacterized protein